MLSVAIIAKDEARYISAAIDSVAGLAGEVLVLLDDRTRDETAAIAQQRGARVLAEPWRGFAAQHNRALGLCDGEWVLFLDADERVTPELRAEIAQVVARDGQSAIAGYWIPRYNQFFGQVLRGGGWYPDHQLRLLRRDAAHYDTSRLVHEFAEVSGPTAYLGGHLLHLNIEQLSELWQKQRAYALQEAQMLFRAGRRARWRNFVGAPAREFVRRFARLGGWRDGPIGLLLCATLAYFEIVKFAHLKGLERAAR